MRSDYAKTLICSAFAVVAVSACSQPVSQSMQQMPQEIDVSEPAETGIWKQTVAGPKIPAAIHPADSFEWVPGNRPIYFHTWEESERTRSTWEPYFRDERSLYPNQKIALGFKVRTLAQLGSDANLVQLPERWTSPRGGFWGVGAPLADDYLHIFECPAGEAVRYRVRDFIFQCSGSSGLDIFVIADPAAEDPPRYSATDPGRGAPEPLPERWLRWFLDARSGEEAMRRNGFDFSHSKRLALLAYAASDDVGVMTERLVRVHRRKASFGDYRYSVEPRLIPAEHCTNDGLEMGYCVPNKR